LAKSFAATDLPVIPITFVLDGQRLSYFSMVTTVGTPRRKSYEWRACFPPTRKPNGTITAGL
jgi:hypothetical protein